MARIDMSKLIVGATVIVKWIDGSIDCGGERRERHGKVTSVRNRGDGTVGVWYKSGKHDFSFILPEDGNTQKDIAIG
jgi:hypothetical protein